MFHIPQLFLVVFLKIMNQQSIQKKTATSKIKIVTNFALDLSFYHSWQFQFCSPRKSKKMFNGFTYISCQSISVFLRNHVAKQPKYQGLPLKATTVNLSVSLLWLWERLHPYSSLPLPTACKNCDMNSSLPGMPIKHFQLLHM